MRVSVIIPAYNEEKFIEKCLISIKNQSFKDIEIIVVDDGSTDKTVEIAEKIADRVILQDHLGCGKARNIGAKSAAGEILVFIDADMYLDEECIGMLIGPIIRGEHKGTCVIDEMVANKENKWSILWSIAHNLPYDRRMPAGIEYMNTFRAIRRDDFLSSEGYYEDRCIGQDKIADRVGFNAFAVKGAVIYHYNTDTFSRCMKDAEKFGKGSVHTFKNARALVFMAKYSVFRSLPVGIIKAVRHGRPGFVFFKIALDFMILKGFIKGKFTKEAME